mmetsp:Transcript_50740/g.83058  ORF Transcript_50740/g.83058 Transcript_50740/m.83058 type:complete len:709 (+) Transcript_50740:426-2552(+)
MEDNSSFARSAVSDDCEYQPCRVVSLSDDESDEELIQELEAAAAEAEPDPTENTTMWTDAADTLHFYEVPGVKDQRADHKKKKEEPNTRVFDFRDGTLPQKAQVVGEGNLEEMNTKATMLRLQPGAYLKVRLGIETQQMIWKKQKEKEKKMQERRARRAKARGEETEEPSAKDEMHQDQLPERREKVQLYTLIMDMLLPAAPPSQGLSVYTTGWPYPTEVGECLVSANLGLGLDESFGQDGSVPLEKWTRVVVTVGSDTMTTYVGGKKCAVVAKKEITIHGGRFAVDPEGIVLFGGGASTEVCIKYVKFIANTALSGSQVRAGTYVDSLYSQWVKDAEKAQQELRQQFTLKALFRKPHPIWADPAFWGEFCDPFLVDTAFGEVNDPMNFLKVLHFSMARMAKEQSQWMGSFMEEDQDRLLSTLKDLERAVGFGLRQRTLQSVSRLTALLKFLKKNIGELGVGQALLLPSPKKIVFMLIKKASGFRFVACAGGDENPYHPSVATLDGKIKYKGCIAIDNIPDDRMQDDSWWMYFLMSMIGDGPEKHVENVYDWLLPWLAGKPLQAAIAETCDEPCSAFRTPPRCQASAYRAFLESVRYLLLWRGMSETKVKAVTFMLRLQYLKFVINDLHCLKKLSDNDNHLIKLGCKQLAHAAVMQAKSKSISPFQLQVEYGAREFGCAAQRWARGAAHWQEAGNKHGKRRGCPLLTP